MSSNSPNRDTDHDLAFDVAMAMANANVPVKDRRRMEALLILADRVIDHLKLCGWKWEKKPPIEGHSTHETSRRDN